MNLKYRKFFLIMLIVILLSGVTSLISPILINYWSQGETGVNYFRIYILLTVLTVSLLLEIILTIFRERFAKEYNKNNFKEMIQKYFKLDYDVILSEGPINLVERIVTAVNSIYQFMTGDYIRIWSSLLVMFIILILAVSKNTMVFSIMLMMIPVNYLGFKYLNKELMKRSQVLQTNTALGWQKILSIMGQTDYLKQCDSYDSLLNQIEPTLDKIYGSMANVNVIAQSASGFIRSLNQIAQTMMMVLIVYQLMDGESNGFTIILFTIIIPIYFQNIQVITSSNLNKRDMTIAINYLNEWDNKLEHNGKVKLSKVENIRLDITILKVKNRILTRNVEGTYKKGDIVWVRGESGTGKSTLMKLIPKFRTENTVWINGIDIREYDNESLRSKVDYLSQNVPIIKGTLRENLFFNKKIDIEIESALEKESILSSVLRNKTMDTIIDEGGGNLSGGEKQKIAIARTLYNSCEILILDEITSNIDEKSAIEILDHLTKSAEDKIIFIISHDDLPGRYSNKELILKS